MNLVDNTAHFDILTKKNYKINTSLVSKLKADSFPVSIIDFYNTMNGFQLKWRFDETLSGGVNFLPSEHLYDSTKTDLKQSEINWYVDNRPTKLDGFFHPIDIITNEAQVGFFDTMKSDKLYYYDSGATFYSLNINIEGYCTLLDHTFGLEIWPRLLIGLRNISFQTDVEFYVNRLCKINPKFNLDKFKNKYSEYQLN